MSKRPYTSYQRTKINFDDDIVIVFKDDAEIYKGIEDYEPMKDENWIWNNIIQAYELITPDNTYIKICLDI